MAGYNWGKVFERVRAKLGRWRARRMSISGRVMAVQLDILPLINHLAVVLPMPFLVGRWLEREGFSFIWGGRVEWVARETMISKVAVGGQGHSLPACQGSMYVCSLPV